MLPLWDNQTHRRPPVITVLLLVANLVVFGYEIVLSLQAEGALETFMMRHALVPARWVAGWNDEAQWLTLGSHMFLHGSVAHVLGNCWFLWIFGRSVEDRLGSLGYLLFYLASGLGAAALQIAVEPSAGVPMVGASGAISGVLGAYFILLPTAWIVALVPWVVPIVPVPAFVFLILWFALQAVNGFGVLMNGTAGAGGVAWWAHAGGFIAGACLTLWAKSNRWVRRS
ncbi:MAG: rhomboid family intrarane serine protease [Rariglobus sp.]|jgi:membrane associated rhomboid family serine protease|nr:rhomboid family intrarane serine protease [Rariglobus sp.]